MDNVSQRYLATICKKTELFLQNRDKTETKQKIEPYYSLDELGIKGFEQIKEWLSFIASPNKNNLYLLLFEEKNPQSKFFSLTEDDEDFPIFVADILPWVMGTARIG